MDLRGLSSGKVRQQWARFLVVNLGGFTLNRGTYALLVAFVALCADQPVYAMAAGAIAGMFFNLGLCRKMVFRWSRLAGYLCNHCPALCGQEACI